MTEQERIERLELLVEDILLKLAKARQQASSLENRLNTAENKLHQLERKYRLLHSPPTISVH
ncbi:hypothetical protein [Bacillus chungangensis]|uniref:Chromosome segregation ATPase n=1 Tax=Bacillus chungangensis TaxID=587633 RepID=A0ABT9WV67_9BACI|nr:hypothetical protein [Bacillus chungangensis]MDQ0177190.1 chromosome segregation ATPase [Bacillus chungangensis]